MSNFSHIITVILLNLLSVALTEEIEFHDCTRSSNSYTSGSIFEANLNNTLLHILPAENTTSIPGFSKYAVGEGINQLYAVSYCRGDIRGQSCRDCVLDTCRAILQRCRGLKEGIIWHKKCTVRYSNRSDILSTSNVEVIPSHGVYNFSGIFPTLENYTQEFNNLMDRLMYVASYDGNKGGFATGEVPLPASELILRGIMQCRPDFVGQNCEICLRSALRQRDGWSTPTVFLPSCNIHLALYPSELTPPPTGGRESKSTLAVVVVVVVSFLVICSMIYLLIRCRRRCQPPEHEQGHRLRKFSFLELAWASSWFSEELGEGGFGRVYRGKLLDGSEVAIKRLSVGGIQGDEEFLTEVDTIKSIVHENAIILHGYCIFFRERLLVYEFVPNKTLEYHLHGINPNLTWEIRMRTAISLAEVFAFLHERDPAIIHRDIKPSNILFDLEFRPKVGDFGIARSCPMSRSHMMTTVKGSLGYLDPCFYTSDRLTRKSDVYSFGIVLLEMVSGRKAIIKGDNPQENRHIVEWAEPLIKEALSERGNFEALVDQKLGTNYKQEEMDCMVTCAAICTRTSPDERPSMIEVAQALKRSEDNNIGNFKEKLNEYWQNDSGLRNRAEGSSCYFDIVEGFLQAENLNITQELVLHNHEISPETFHTSPMHPISNRLV